MLVRFKSFGPIRRLLEEQVIDLDVPSDSNVFQVVQIILERGGQALRDLILDDGQVSGNFIILLNKKDVSTIGGLGISVNEGDEIAILPHVQGG